MPKKDSNSNKILILDDDSFLLDMYVLKFKHEGFNVLAAKSSREALDFLKEHKDIEIALLDIILPEMDGFALAEKIQADNISPDTIYVFLTNLSQETDVQKAKKLGVNHFIIKANNTPTEVVNQVKEILNK